MPEPLARRIYQAQCLGNVEPIEYMTPYPNLPGLVSGQNIKHRSKMLYADLGITNRDFSRRVQQIAHWLTSQGLQAGQRVYIVPQEFPLTEMLVFGIWSIGASVILSDQDKSSLSKIITPDLSVTDPLKFKDFDCYPTEFVPVYPPALEYEALVYITAGKGIRLSHYNLLMNANDVHRRLDIYDDSTFYVDLPPTNTAWAVLQAILPLYTGAPLTQKDPLLTIGLHNTDYIVDHEWSELNNPTHLYILPENTAVLSLGSRALQLTAYKLKAGVLTVEGHSVMMGYTNNRLNEKVFTGGPLVLQLNQ